jgi:hypothetical protein
VGAGSGTVAYFQVREIERLGSNESLEVKASGLWCFWACSGFRLEGRVQQLGDAGVAAVIRLSWGGRESSLGRESAAADNAA